MRFLDELTAVGAICEILDSSSKARIAVAFWGTGAAKRLGLLRTDLDVQVVCNLDSGACNPSEIAALMAAGVAVRTNPRLHGKVYWTPSAMVLGSSNASANGLAVEGSSLVGWTEANILVTAPEVLQSAAHWISEQWEAADVITKERLASATELWKARARGSSPGARLTGDLLAAYTTSPEHPAWNQLKVVIWTTHLSRPAESEVERNVTKNPRLSDHEAYEGWHSEFVEGDWIIDIDASGPRPRFTGYWSVPTPKVETERLTFVLEKAAVRLPAFPPLTLSKTDVQRLLRNTSALLPKGAEGIAMLFGKALQRIQAAEDSEPSPAVDETSKAMALAFDRAMRSIYEQAKSIGYNAADFRTLVHQRGGRAAAKHLLRPGPPSPGLARLYALGRPEISVEALVQRSEWRHLFTEAELKTAHQRYPGR